MKPVVAICVLVIVVTLNILHKTVLMKEERYCSLIEEFEELRKKIRDIQNNSEICNIEQAIYTDSMMFIYSPDDRELYFYQFKVLISEIEGCYNWIKNFEQLFQEEEWKRIQRQRLKFADLVNNVCNEEWIRPF